MYRSIKSEKIIKTIEDLRSRIEERFPKASLVRVCEELLLVATQSQEKINTIKRPDYRLRIALGVMVFLFLTIFYNSIQEIPNALGIKNLSDFIQLLGASSEALTLLGLVLFFIITFEQRMKKNKALKALHELRSLAHVIDMHQLTKDPYKIIKNIILTKSSPKVDMNANELLRYLNYCAEMLSIIGKIAALYGEHLQDPASIATVNDIEDLSTGLSRKIWQKMMILKA